jgi:DNA ligase 4
MAQNNHIAAEQLTTVVERLRDNFRMSDADVANLSPGWLFYGLSIYFHHDQIAGGSAEEHRRQRQSPDLAMTQRFHLAANLCRFGGAEVLPILGDSRNPVTHVVVSPKLLSTELSSLRGKLAARIGHGSGAKMAHVVTVDWIEECWKEKTLLDEESTYIRMIHIAAPHCSRSPIRLFGLEPPLSCGKCELGC